MSGSFSEPLLDSKDSRDAGLSSMALPSIKSPTHPNDTRLDIPHTLPYPPFEQNTNQNFSKQAPHNPAEYKSNYNVYPNGYMDQTNSSYPNSKPYKTLFEMTNFETLNLPNNPQTSQPKAMEVIRTHTAELFDKHPTKSNLTNGTSFKGNDNHKSFYNLNYYHSDIHNLSKNALRSNKFEDDNQSLNSVGSSSSGPASSDDESETESLSNSYNIQNYPHKPYQVLSNPNETKDSLEINQYEHQPHKYTDLNNGIDSRPKRNRRQTDRYEEAINTKKVRRNNSTLSWRDVSSSPLNSINGTDNIDHLQQSSHSNTSPERGSNTYFDSTPTESDINCKPNFRYKSGKGRPPKSRTTNAGTEQNEAFYVGRGVRAGKRTKSLRERTKIIDYAALGAEYETDDEDKAVDTERSNQEAEQAYIPSVDRVISNRINPETNATEYFIKWKSQAHIHNTWEAYENLQKSHGIKKVDNYIRRLQNDKIRRSSMTADEVEQEDIAYELQRQLDDDATLAERVIEKSTDPNTNEPIYLVKWLSCPYDQCTWESEETLVNHKFKHLVDDFHEREDRIHGGKASISYWNNQSFSRTKFEPYLKTPYYMEGGKHELRDYQLTGLNWMVSRMKYGLSVLLADEMGLGKTVQTISLIGHMIFTENLVGPYLVIVPQSTIDNWLREFHFWLPKINAVCLHGNAMGRDMLRFYELRQVSVPNKGTRWRFDVCITTPSILNSPPDIDFLRKIYWQLMVVDEAHQLKNRNSKRFQELKLFQAEFKLLLSGTPLHNNLEEMWTLLHFTNPLRYAYYEDFRRKYPDIENTSEIGETKRKQLTDLQSELHEVVLRRVKKDVEKSLPNKVESILQVEMSPFQEQWYENVYTRNYEQLARSSGGARNSLQNICMELKKVCNHPFLCSAPQSPGHYQSGLVQGSGKMCLLEKLLIRLKEKNHRVLIFSQMVRMLNLLSEYLTIKGFKHQRLDGSMGKELRKKAMDHFNAPDSDDFVFLLSTKAGGLGINLTTADTVVIYDSDWNPQNDLQAEARAHRIGQTKTVQIYRLVTKNSIEQSILERAKTKMVLDTLVVQGLNKKQPTDNQIMIGGANASSQTSFTREELSRILRFGAQNLWKRHESTTRDIDQPIEVDLDKVLEEAQVTTNESTGVADDLLSSFNNIAEFRYEPSNDLDNINDKDFWATTIPLEERLKFKTAKEQELLVLGPRKTRAREGFAVHGTDDDYVEEDSNTAEEGKRRISSKLKKKSSYHMSEKDRYRLYRSLLKYGTTSSRLSDIHEDSRLVRFDTNVIEQECQVIIEICRKRLQEIGYNFKAVDDEGTESSQQLSDQTKNEDFEINGKNCNISRHFVAIGENKANAVDLVERVELLTMLDSYIKNQNLNHPEPWKLPTGPIPHPGSVKQPLPELRNQPLILTLPEKVLKKLKEWTAKDVRNWGALQDINLLRGTYIYGFGAWTDVYTDPNLDLEQIKDIKFDKVKMRALRTLKLLQNALDESKGKQKKQRPLKSEIKEDPSLKLEQSPGDTSSISTSINNSENPLNPSPDGSQLTQNSLKSPTRKSSHTEKKAASSKGKLKLRKLETNKETSSPISTDKVHEEPTMESIDEILTKDLKQIEPLELKKYVKAFFRPLKKQLKRLRSLPESKQPQSEIISKMKRLVPIFGDYIAEAVAKFTNSDESANIFHENCWNHVSSFTSNTSKHIQLIYLNLLRQRNSEEANTEEITAATVEPETINGNEEEEETKTNEN